MGKYGRMGKPIMSGIQADREHILYLLRQWRLEYRDKGADAELPLDFIAKSVAGGDTSKIWQMADEMLHQGFKDAYGKRVEDVQGYHEEQNDAVNAVLNRAAGRTPSRTYGGRLKSINRRRLGRGQKALGHPGDKPGHPFRGNQYS